MNLRLLALWTMVSAQVFAAEPAKQVVPAAPAALPRAEEIAHLAVYPPSVKLRGLDDAVQMIVTAVLKDGAEVDVTGDSQISSTLGAGLKFSTTGRVAPLANGNGQITVAFAGAKAQIPVEAASCDTVLPINFPNQIVPIFTKLSCNSGGCHGKASGQNGFKLSLLGFEPEIDFMTLVKEGRGRRTMPTSPDTSLLLTKGAGTIAHGGGRKLDPASDEYKLVRRWIASGMPYGKPTDPTLKSISVHPERRVMSRQSRQQFAVLAHYSDGSQEDITRRAQYESNDVEIATVDTGALVRSHGMSGEAAIMVRFQDQVSTFRAVVPVTRQPKPFTFSENTLVDKHTTSKWKELGLTPSDLAGDLVFLRRVHLDITGTLPTPEQVKAFMADTGADKRSRLVDSLVDSPEYSYYFAAKWADILRVKRGGDAGRTAGTFAFHGWLRDAMSRDMPYDQMARAVIAGTGDESMHPPVLWTKSLTGVEQFVDDTAQVFLGLRMTCAQCHHHPYEKWSQDDYWGLAAFFGRIGKKEINQGSDESNAAVKRVVVFNQKTGSVTNKRTQQVAAFKPLDGKPMDVAPGTDPRSLLADWLTAKENPFFARAVANRYWAHFFGKGIVDPLDDMRLTNPASNPALLDALSKELIVSGYSLKHLVKTICKSHTYQLSAEPNDTNKNDKQNFARYYPRRLAAEVIFDAVCQVTASPSGFGGVPSDTNAPRRAIMLPDESFASYFLDVFGRPQRISACECERVGEANLAQALHLLNSDEIQGMLTRAGGRADVLAKDTRPDADKIDDLFLRAFGRLPAPEQKKAALDHLAKHAKDKKVGLENILWALLNTKEFLFVQ